MFWYCRFCAQPKTTDIFNLDMDETKRKDVMDKLTFLNASYVDISDRSRVPRAICFHCYDSLIITHDFLFEVREAQDVFRKLFPESYPQANDSLDNVERSELKSEPSELNGSEESFNVENCENDENETNDDKGGISEVLVQSISNTQDSMSLDSEPRILVQVTVRKDMQQYKLSDRLNKWANGSQYLKYELDEVEDENNVEQNDTCVIDEDRDVSSGAHKQQTVDCQLNIQSISGNTKYDANTRSEQQVQEKEKYKKTHEEDCTCTVCNKKIICANAFQVHTSGHKSASHRNYICDKCGDMFSRKQDIIDHMTVHSNERAYLCDVCKMVFRNKSYLRRHILIHSNFKPYSCKTCRRSFSCKRNLTRHQRVHSEVKPYSCDVCNWSFIYKSYLTRHQRVHSGVKPYSCDVCHRSFAKKSNLTSHQRLHSGVKPYSCEVCHQSFAYKSVLTSHQRVHSGVKPYSCAVCHRSFADKSQLTTHQRAHSVVKPYSCAVCHRSFAKKSHLTTHQRVHSGAKPYSCDVCHRSFAIKRYLTIHQRVHSGAKPYSCDVCHRSFADKSNVRRHQQLVHSGV